MRDFKAAYPESVVFFSASGRLSASIACAISVSVARADQSARFSCSAIPHRYRRILSSCSCAVLPVMDGYASVRLPMSSAPPSVRCRGRCPHRPTGNLQFRRSVFRFGRAFCRADVGIGPYRTRYTSLPPSSTRARLNSFISPFPVSRNFRWSHRAGRTGSRNVRSPRPSMCPQCRHTPSESY